MCKKKCNEAACHLMSCSCGGCTSDVADRLEENAVYFGRANSVLGRRHQSVAGGRCDREARSFLGNCFSYCNGRCVFCCRSNSGASERTSSSERLDLSRCLDRSGRKAARLDNALLVEFSNQTVGWVSAASGRPVYAPVGVPRVTQRGIHRACDVGLRADWTSLPGRRPMAALTQPTAVEASP